MSSYASPCTKSLFASRNETSQKDPLSSNFDDAESAWLWYRSLSFFKRTWLSLRAYPHWPFTINGRRYVDLGSLRGR